MYTKIFDSNKWARGHCPLMDMLMILVTNKIRYLFIVILIFMWFKNDSSKKVSYLALKAAGITIILNTLIKAVYFKPRPFVKHRVGILVPAKRDSTFPSKHTLLVFAISTAIYLYDRVLGIIMMLLSSLTGFSRIWVGHHYPADIIGSAFIGMLTSIVLDKVKTNKMS
ncbi:undecaprenyl-diphosphatase [Cytobacillus horneckiae]|uniref:Undecaprenyl-diphosphatase n=1 Tax=Cytobacillus horneckiae TaxID=549687 RepID=A0A2N0ZIH5_9BACI|nr:undecaprenyl-diphosphatase [Cytobacillus horneckiae]MEC1157412.1 undecaprenyl-diphosphatase [Cytobacillus horneckiae]MED2935707.1 undecaprenyl-diphosphatase [Cytobacillus horneckiae]PKG29298.1 undecaprenyl-diphosphatase [Cytobacillus horneckiae]